MLKIKDMNLNNVIRQGDTQPREYQLDTGNLDLNLTNKSATIRLMTADFQGIGYETTATVSSENKISFSIDDVIPARQYRLEVTVDDYVFPSRATDGQFSIDPSSHGQEVNIINVIGKEEIVREVKEQVISELGVTGGGGGGYDDIAVQSHLANRSNPHQVTKAQVGLGNVDDIKQASKIEFDNHNQDDIRHITASERNSWNKKPITYSATPPVDTNIMWVDETEEGTDEVTSQLAQTVGVNVLDYNSLQEALDSGHTNLVIPKGVYEVRTSLKVPDGVTLIGVDQPVLRTPETSGTSAILMLQGSATVDGIVFDGNKHNNTTTASPDGINLAGSDFNIKISDCKFKDISGRGITGNAKNATIKNCDFDGVSWYPIRVSYADYFLVDGCSFYISETDTTYDSSVRAILPEECKRVTITNCVFDTNYMYRDGIWVASCEDVILTNNHISRTLDDQITIKGVSKRVVIANNVLRYSNQTSGVLLLASTDKHTEIVINGNIITDCVAGVDLRSTNGAIITGNAFKNMHEGVRFSESDASTNAIVANNNFEELGLHGVAIGTSTNVRIDNNNFKGIGTGIGVHGGNGNDVYVTNNSFSGFVNGVQTVKGNMKILGNNFSLISDRGIHLSSGQGVTISGNNFIDVPSPIVSPVRDPSEDVIISDNTANLEVLGYSAIDLGVSKNILITGNRFSGYINAVQDVDLAQGKPENIIATSNNFIGCTNVSFGEGVNVTLDNNLI